MLSLTQPRLSEKHLMHEMLVGESVPDSTRDVECSSKACIHVNQQRHFANAVLLPNKIKRVLLASLARSSFLYYLVMRRASSSTSFSVINPKSGNLLTCDDWSDFWRFKVDGGAPLAQSLMQTHHHQTNKWPGNLWGGGININTCF